MAMQVVFGTKRNPLATDALIDALQPINPKGTLYIGYPIVAVADDNIFVDALLTCEEYGLVAFDLEPVVHNDVTQRQDNLYAALLQRLISFRPLRTGRTLSFHINVVTFAPSEDDESDDPRVVSASTLGNFLTNECLSISPDLLTAIDSSVQRVTTIKPLRRRSRVRRSNSKGAALRKIEAKIATLDQWQKTAAIETPEGPQRIRGLAGSGKTIVLALKAAYLHTQHPEWTIAVTFHTRSLYQQFTDLITRFTFEHIGDHPDWKRLRLLHTWGSATKPGLYSEIAIANNVRPLAFAESKARFGSAQVFKGVCSELLKELNSYQAPAELYDAVLIDEAQDLPQEFFEIIFLSTKEPKRIAFAYDELQNLGSYVMVPPDELFGSDTAGNPRVHDLQRSETEARQDIVLPVCYRNTPWTLTVAHALGFGLHRNGGMVQFFDDPNLLLEVGYEITSGRLASGEQVELRRSSSSAPSYFDRFLNRREIIREVMFDTNITQAEWVAEQVSRNLDQDELEHRDILIIVTDPIRAQKQASPIMRALNRRDIPSHLAGVTSSVDELFQEDSIAISGIYRAKGHEAAVVYVVDCQYANSNLEAGKRRNILFTAITRSRAWVILCGVRPRMQAISAEVNTVLNNDYRLSFSVPTDEQLARIRRIHRDRSRREVEEVIQATVGLRQVIEKIRRGDLDIQNLPRDLRDQLRDLKDLLGDR